MDELKWRKSSHSNSGGQCVEVADLQDGGKAVRNSRFPDGPVLEFTRDEFEASLLGVRDDQFG